MAVVLRLSDRRAAAAILPDQSGRHQGTAEILILPCIRRERLERQVQSMDCAAIPAQLHA